MVQLPSFRVTTMYEFVGNELYVVQRNQNEYSSFQGAADVILCIGVE